MLKTNDLKLGFVKQKTDDSLNNTKREFCYLFGMYFLHKTNNLF